MLSLNGGLSTTGAAAGTGSLVLRAGVIDATLAVVRGYASTMLIAGDLRLRTPDVTVKARP